MIDVPLTNLGGTLAVMASGVGDADPVVIEAAVTGASVLPLAPVALGWTAGADSGAAVRWTRRSRAGWRWLGGVDAPLGEESETYRVTIESAGGFRALVTAEPATSVTAAERSGGVVTVTVRQRGTYGESSPAMIQLEEKR